MKFARTATAGAESLLAAQPRRVLPASASPQVQRVSVAFAQLKAPMGWAGDPWWQRAPTAILSVCLCVESCQNFRTR